MSRVGKKIIEVPANVTIEVKADNLVTVKGPKGELTRQFHQDMKFEQEGNTIAVVRPSESKEHRTNHGTTRALLANMVTGVSEGFSRSLELIG
ncbi:50S ribosomal protein L6, partial [Weissella confusa]|uniref:50S ribosomal protein L6 n=1 Tax=Weissella confusa TaxID=1583 RepID=UPI001BCBB2F2